MKGMWRGLLFFLKLALLVALAVWLANHPGAVEIEWLGYRVSTSIGLLALSLLLFALLAVLFWRGFALVWRTPSRLGRHFEANRRERGYKALSHGMVAVAAGDAPEAARWARKAEALLDEPPLTRLLMAQAAQMNGDERAARRYFEAMLQSEETRFLGLRGLLTQALRKGDETAARDYLRQAHALRPDANWVLTSLFELSERAGDLDAAEAALSRALKRKALAKPEGQRKRAVVLLERAQSEAQAGDRRSALSDARAAFKAAPDLVPAAALLAELEAARGSRRKAAQTLERGWQAAPHPDLAAAWLALHPDLDSLGRLKKLREYTMTRADHPETRIALARAALAAELWGEARRHLAPLEREGDQRAYRLLAEIEEREKGDTAAAAEWRRKAEEAVLRAPAWVCTACGTAADRWSAHCQACGAFDGLEWRSPPHILAAEPTGITPPPPSEGDGAERAARRPLLPIEPATPPPPSPAKSLGN